MSVPELARCGWFQPLKCFEHLPATLNPRGAPWVLQTSAQSWDRAARLIHFKSKAHTALLQTEP